MILALLIVPFAAGLVLLLFRSILLNRAILILVSLFELAVSVTFYFCPAELAPYFRVDPLNGLLLIVTAAVLTAAAVYNAVYQRHSTASAMRETVYSALLLAFSACLTGVLLSTHLGLLWVFLEATTLASTPLIYFDRSKTSLEATWKYVFICSIGISLAFAGIVLLSYAVESTGSLFFANLANPLPDGKLFWMKLAFPFLALGFGTKAGLAPVHGWLPDAHSEAPSPVSALLSGALLNAAFLGLIRISDLTGLAGLGHYRDIVFRLMGFLSLFVCAVFILRSSHFKRMLAYSSIENIGIACIGLTLGAPGRLAVVIHLVAHSFAKAGLFLTSGNIALQMKTREIDRVTGLLKSDHATGWLWIAGFLAVSAFPPFPAFVSELLVMKGLLGTSVPLFCLFGLLLVLILFGMGRNVFQMSFGTPPRNAEPGCRSLWSYLPQSILLLLLLAMGVGLFFGLTDVFSRAAGLP